jgi:hypothetical protein
VKDVELRALHKAIVRNTGYIEMYIRRKQYDIADDRAEKLLNMVLRLRAEIRVRGNIHSLPSMELIRERVM